jgi:hypothetical protein
MPEDILRAILAEFDIPRINYVLTPIEHGLINKSYKVIEEPIGQGEYFLQQIDHDAFADIEGIMHNIEVVCNHFKTLPEAPEHLSTQQTTTGANYYKSADGEYWRLYNYVAGDTYYRADNDKIAAEAGSMFGHFLTALQGIDVNLVRTTIPRFHDINLRYEQFESSLATADPERKQRAKNLIKLAEENISFTRDIYREIVNNCSSILTHNDTKLSNLLFDSQQRGICVVDYDTLMPGYLTLDFGDSVRSICSTTLEDDTNLGGTYFDLKIFKSFTLNFIQALGTKISEAEIKLFAKTVAYMPYLMGLRMLTDYLNNDVYYTTQYEHHNFDRASNQLALFISGTAQLNEMNNIVFESMNNQSS